MKLWKSIARSKLQKNTLALGLNYRSIRDLKQNSQRIPEVSFDFKPLLQKDMNFIQQQYEIQNLRTKQKEYHSDPENFDKAYGYAQALIRNNRYKDAQEILRYDQNFTLDQIRKLKDLVSDYNQRNEQKQNTTPRPIFFWFILAYLAYRYGPDVPTFQKEEEKGKKDAESKSTNRGGLGMERIMSMMGRTQVVEERNISTRFKDVLGINEFKEELEEIVDYLKNPLKYTQSGAKLPKGLLLVGPPGTGKTLLARALAGEANCAFFYKSGAEFDEMFVGVGASRVRELFQKARQRAPSIIFIDEIDSIGGTRRVSDPSWSRETINQILTEMDGFKQSESVIVIGATNFEKVLDPALKRPGRFDKIIHIPLPDIKGREEIFDYYLRKIKFNTLKIQPGYLARQTSGFSGADIQNMVNVAILNAIKNSRQTAEPEDFEFAVDRISMGVGRKNMFVSEKDKLSTAYHEGGHALTSLLTEGAVPLHKVTILPRGGALGFTSMIPEKDQLNYTKKGILAQIDVAMGGRAAEDIFMGKDLVTSGCSNDLAKATQLAYMYVKELGMDDTISLISIQGGDRIKTSDQFDYMIDMEVKKILDLSYERVRGLLLKNEKKLKDLATELVRKETLNAEEVKKLIGLF